MGKATNANLPDPLNELSPTADGAVGTDDLLSQLAGDEIDRLLAEADIELPPVTERRGADVPDADALDTALAEAAAEDAASVALAALDEVKVHADAIENDLRPPTPNDESTAATTETAAAPSEVSGELDALFKEINANDGTLPRAPEVVTAEAASPEATTAGASLDDSDLTTSRAERAGLDLDAFVAGATPTADSSEPMHRASGNEGAIDTHTDSRIDFNALHAVPAIPIWLRPLEWLSAPMADASDASRDLVGKAAIVTFVNATAVIVYVMFFRQNG